MKKSVLLAVGLLVFCSVAYAGEKEELLLKKENLELQIQNIQLTAQLMNRHLPEIQTSLKEVTDKLQALGKKEIVKEESKHGSH